MKNIKKPGGNHYPAIKGLKITRSFTCLPLGLPYPQSSPHTPAPLRSSLASKHQLANQYTLKYLIYKTIIISIILEPGPSGESSFARPIWAVWMSISSEGASVHPKVALETMGVKGSVPRPSRSPTWRWWRFSPQKNHGTKTLRKHWKVQNLFDGDRWMDNFCLGGYSKCSRYICRENRKGWGVQI